MVFESNKIFCKKNSSILIIIDYFGELPFWMDFFLESCRWNPTVNWLIHTDCDVAGLVPDNVEIKQMSWDEYVNIVSKKLKIKFNPQEKYKICDIRPAFGIIWDDAIKNYDFFGYSDLDIIYGDIRAFYTEDVLKNNIISTHEWCFSGHLLLMKNEEWIINSFRKVKKWRELFEDGYNIRFDEDYFFRAFLRPNRFDNPKFKWFVWLADRLNPLRRKYRQVYMKEQFTTPLVPSLWHGQEVNHSCLWFWQAGRITNDANGYREFIYLHFMNFKNSRYLDSSFEAAPWLGLKKIINVKPGLISKGFSVGLNGIHPYHLEKE